jgi:branched-subunit amino acid transport protein
MDRTTLCLTILGMGAVTYLPRLLPLWLLASRRLPRPVVVWLRYVPVAVLAAMLAPALILQEGQLAIRLGNLFLWAAVPTSLVAWRRRSMFSAVIVGMAVVALARLLLRM